jgi:hypothetical protein
LRKFSVPLNPSSAELFASTLAKLNLLDVNIPETILLGGLSQGFDTVCRLIRLLGTALFVQSRVTVTAMKRSFASIMGLQRRLWNLVVSMMNCSSDVKDPLPQLVKHFFHILQDLVLYLSQPQWKGSMQQQAYLLWAQCVAEGVHVSQGSSSQTMSDEVIFVLDISTQLSSRAPGLASVVYEILQPIAKALQDAQNVHPIICAKTQVRKTGNLAMI